MLGRECLRTAGLSEHGSDVISRMARVQPETASIMASFSSSAGGLFLASSRARANRFCTLSRLLAISSQLSVCWATSSKSSQIDFIFSDCDEHPATRNRAKASATIETKLHFIMIPALCGTHGMESRQDRALSVKFALSLRDLHSERENAKNPVFSPA